MFEKFIQTITGLTPAQWLGIVILVLMGAAYIYVDNLKDTIVEKDGHIAVLQLRLKEQDDSINLAAQAKAFADQRVKNVEISNGRLQKKVEELNGSITKLPPAKTADEALNRISKNAERLAKEWNK